MEDRISVVIPTYNREKTIGATLESLIKQHWKNWEALVVDDGSSDHTLAVVAGFEENESRIKHIKRETMPRGGNACRNIGFQNSSGNFVVFLDSDDLLLPDCFENRIATVQRNPGKDFLVFPGAVFSDNSGHPGYYWNIPNERLNDLGRFISFDSPWQTTGAIWKTEFLKNRRIVWDENLAIWQDVDFHISVLAGAADYEVCWNCAIDYLVRSDSPDSLSRSDYFTPQKNNSRLYFWEKHAELTNSSRVSPAVFRNLVFILLKSAIVEKNVKRFNELNDEALKKGIINKEEYRLFKKNALTHRISFGKWRAFSFPDNELQKIFRAEQSPTLQKVRLSVADSQWNFS